jgi:hypothetical protein
MRLFLLNLLTFAGHERQDSGGLGGKMYVRVSRVFLAQKRKGAAQFETGAHLWEAFFVI